MEQMVREMKPEDENKREFTSKSPIPYPRHLGSTISVSKTGNILQGL